MLTQTIYLTLKSLLKHYTIPDNQLEVVAKEIVKILPKKHRERLIVDDRNVIPPCIYNVIKYCAERNRGVDPAKWFAHYEAIGWKVGKNKMVDWQAAVRTWEHTEDKNGTQPLDTGRRSDPLGPIKRIVQTKSGPREVKDGRLADCEPVGHGPYAGGDAKRLPEEAGIAEHS